MRWRKKSVGARRFALLAARPDFISNAFISRVLRRDVPPLGPERFKHRELLPADQISSLSVKTSPAAKRNWTQLGPRRPGSGFRSRRRRIHLHHQQMVGQIRTSPDGAGQPQAAHDSSSKDKVALLPTPKHLYRLKPEAFETISTIFPAKKQDLKQSSAWQDFCAAMFALEFSAEQGAGSAVTFKTVDGGRKSSNVVHIPHPEKKLAWNKLIHTRNRLQRRFGWSSASFSCLAL